MGSKYLISVLTEAETSGLKAAQVELAKTTAAVDKLTEAEKRSAKSAADSAKVFGDALKARASSADQASYLSNLTKEAKEMGEVDKATGKLAISKKGLKDVLQGVSRSIPELGVLMTALKSPITIVATLAALATAKFLEFKAAIDELGRTESGSAALSKMSQTFHELTQDTKNRATAFADSLKVIDDAAVEATEQLKALNEQIALKARLEEEAVDRELSIALAGVTDPARKEQLEKVAASKKKDIGERKSLATAIGAENKGRLAREASEREMPALAAADAAILEAEKALSEERRKSGLALETDALRRPKYVQTIRELEDDLKRPEWENSPLFPGGKVHPQLRESVEKKLQDAKDEVSAIDTRRDQSNSLIKARQGDLDRAIDQRDEIAGRISRNRTASVAMGRDAKNQFGLIAMERQADPEKVAQASAQAFTQRRADALIDLREQALTRAYVGQLGSVVEKAAKELTDVIVKSLNDSARRIDRNSSDVQ